jgi:hypothetical protein
MPQRISRRAVIVSVYRLRGAEEKRKKKEKKERVKTNSSMWNGARSDIDAPELALACGRFLFCWKLE